MSPKPTVKKLTRLEFAKLIEFYVFEGYDISVYLFRPASHFNHENLRSELELYTKKFNDNHG